MKLRRALSVVLALALLPGLAVATLNTGKKVKASGEHDIHVGAQTNMFESYDMLDYRYGQEDLTVMGGTVSLNKYSAEEGETITITVTPNPGFAIQGVYWGDGEGGDHFLGVHPDFTFEMWDDDVHVSVLFEDEVVDYYAAVMFEPSEGADGWMDAVILDTQADAEAFVLPECTFDHPSGIFFMYWDKGDGETLFAPGDPCPVDIGTTFFYARHAAGSKIAFNGGSGTGTMDPVIVLLEDQGDWMVPECAFTPPEGMKFFAWENCGVLYYPGSPYEILMDNVLFQAVYTPENPSCYVVTANSLNVRENPDEDAYRIGSVSFGRTFQATAEIYVNGKFWVGFDYNGQLGWVDREFLKLTPSLDLAIDPVKYEVTVGALNVRSAPEKIDSPSNRIGGLTVGDKVTVTAKTTDDENNEWLAIEYSSATVPRTVGWIMAKYTAGELDKADHGSRSLKINFSLPSKALSSARCAIAGASEDSEANLSEDQIENKEDGLLKALIYPADAHNFRELTQGNITLPDGIGMEVMDMLLQEDGGILVTFCPENAVSVAFHGATSGDVFTKYISSGNLIAQPADPVMEGATFDGWYEDEACTVKFDFSKPVTGDISLFSNFLKNEPTSNQAQENTETESEPEVVAPAVEIVYTATSDADTWTRGSMKSITITVKRNIDDAELCFASFRSAAIDGTPLVLDKDYSVKKGSTIVTIYSAALENLSDGTHTITVEFADGKSEFTLKVEQPAATVNTADDNTATPTPTPANTVNKSRAPKTGDVASQTRTVIVIILGVVGLAAVGTVLALNRKKDEENETSANEASDPDQK